MHDIWDAQRWQHLPATHGQDPGRSGQPSPYLDDTLVFSKGEDNHLLHLKETLERLSGIAPLPGRVDAIATRPRPTNVKELQNFLGVINFYRKFVPGAVSILHTLVDALKGSPKPRGSVEWIKDHRDAFQAAKDSLRKATHMAFPRAGAEIALMVDASANHMGAALQQRELATAVWQPLGFFSKKLDATQRRCLAYDRELLACVQGIRHFWFMLEGRPFTLYTNHKPLTFRPLQGGGGLDHPPEQTPEVRDRVHKQHQAHQQLGQRGG